jgi:hypothetical protein
MRPSRILSSALLAVFVMAFSGGQALAQDSINYNASKSNTGNLAATDKNTGKGKKTAKDKNGGKDKSALKDKNAGKDKSAVKDKNTAKDKSLGKDKNAAKDKSAGKDKNSAVTGHRYYEPVASSEQPAYESKTKSQHAKGKTTGKGKPADEDEEDGSTEPPDMAVQGSDAPEH